MWPRTPLLLVLLLVCYAVGQTSYLQLAGIRATQPGNAGGPGAGGPGAVGHARHLFAALHTCNQLVTSKFVHIVHQK